MKRSPRESVGFIWSSFNQGDFTAHPSRSEGVDDVAGDGRLTVVTETIKKLAAGVVDADLRSEEEALAPLVIGPGANVHSQRTFGQLLTDPACAVGIGEELQAPDAGEHVVHLPEGIPRRAPPLGIGFASVKSV